LNNDPNAKDYAQFNLPGIYFNWSNLHVSVGQANGNQGTLSIVLPAPNKTYMVIITCVGDTNQLEVVGVGKNQGGWGKYRYQPRQTVKAFAGDGQFPAAKALVTNLTYELV